MDEFDNYQRPEGGDGYHNTNFHSGLTSYERPRRPRPRKANPYHRSNMIYAKPPRRWPRLVIALIIIVLICTGAFAACKLLGSSTHDESGTAQQTQSAKASPEQQPQSEQVGSQAGSADEGQGTPAESGDGSASGAPGSADAGANTQGAGVSADERTKTSDSRNDVKPGRKVVYLTFDDGPSSNTDEILRILDEAQVKATWFVIGVTGKLEKTADIWAGGHQLALHTNSHEYDQVYASTDAFWNEIDTIATKVEQQVGFKPTLFRFPGGSVNDYNTAISKELRAQSYEKGYHYFDWNVSSSDAASNSRTVEQILKNIKKESKGCNSCCVLMHDTDAKGTTVQALPQIIEYYKGKGFEFDVLTADSFGYHFQEDD